MVLRGDPKTREVWLDDRRLKPKTSQKVVNHSPDGFNWGYEGSGPAQLALAVLLAAGLPRDEAVRHYQWFKREVIAALPQGEPFAVMVDLDKWLADRATRSY